VRDPEVVARRLALADWNARNRRSINDYDQHGDETCLSHYERATDRMQVQRDRNRRRVQELNERSAA
jgi:hypothetical protein